MKIQDDLWFLNLCLVVCMWDSTILRAKEGRLKVQVQPEYIMNSKLLWAIW